MLSELLQDRSALYVSGAMTAPERENFELLLEFHAEVRAYVADLERATTRIWLSHLAPTAAPPSALKSRILGSVGLQPAPPAPEGIVVTDPAGHVEWVNPAFSALCGYTLAELKGRKPGHLLQGPATDPHTVQRIRSSVAARAACCETLTNYHRDGSTYVVRVAIAPILDDDRQPLWFVARERKLTSAPVSTPVSP